VKLNIDDDFYMAKAACAEGWVLPLKLDFIKFTASDASGFTIRFIGKDTLSIPL